MLGSVEFFYFLFPQSVPTMFPPSSKRFPWSSKVPNVFPIASHFYSICFAQSCPLFIYIGWAKYKLSDPPKFQCQSKWLITKQKKVKISRHPHFNWIELNHAYTTHRIAPIHDGIKFIFCVVRNVYQRSFTYVTWKSSCDLKACHV